MASLRSGFRIFLNRHIALPQDHGSWVFIISPLLIGIWASGVWTPAMGWLIGGVMSAFLLRQPITIAVKVYSKRRPRTELPAARFWTVIYTVLALISLSWLISRGFSYLLWLAIPGIIVFAWHLLLVQRRQERRQLGVELAATGVLALAAPAGFWIGRGGPDPLGWWLFAAVWLQSAASIVYAYLRLEQRTLTYLPPVADRLRMGWRALAYTTFNVIVISLLSIRGNFPPLLPLPYVLQWGEVIWGTLRPAIGWKPVSIGVRQLAISTLFTLLFLLTWRSWPG